MNPYYIIIHFYMFKNSGRTELSGSLIIFKVFPPPKAVRTIPFSQYDFTP